MKARKLIEGASFDPATLAAVGEAFDRAWAADHFADSHEQVERARARLAHAVLAVDDESRDPEILKQQALEVIRSMGVTVVPFDLPEVSIPAIDFIRYAETAAFFDDATRGGVLTAVEQGPEKSARPIEIRSAYVTPAVQYIQANRFRTRVMQQMDEAMSDLDLFVGSHLLLTNRTGHPVVSLPSGFHRGLPTALHLTGKIFGDSDILLLAHTFQAVTTHHRRRPPL